MAEFLFTLCQDFDLIIHSSSGTRRGSVRRKRPMLVDRSVDTPLEQQVRYDHFAGHNFTRLIALTPRSFRTRFSLFRGHCPALLSLFN